MATYNPLDPYEQQTKKKAYTYVPTPIGTTDTGIPQINNQTQTGTATAFDTNNYDPYAGGDYTLNQQTDYGIPIPYTPAQHGGDYTVPYGYNATIPSGIVNTASTGQNVPYETVDMSQTGAPAPAPAPSTALPGVLPGWDATKWADPTHTTPKYVIGRILARYQASPDSLLRALPEIQAQYPGATLVGTDTLNIPGVGLVDVGGNFNDAVTGNENWWWGADSGQAPAEGPGIPAAGTGTGATNALAAGGTGGTQSGYNDAIWSKILELLGQDPIDVSTSPTYQSAIRAYDVEQQRASERERNAIAERMAAEGTNYSGGFNDRVLGAEQQRGENTASFAGQLGVRALEMQRDEIMQALQLGAGLMTDQQRLALTEKLGLINAALQQQSITNQNNQFNSSLGWQMAQWPSQQAYLAWLYGGGGA